MIIQTSDPKFSEKLEEIVPQHRLLPVTLIYPDGKSINRRLGRSGATNGIILMLKNRTNKGTYLNPFYYTALKFSDKPDLEKWRKSWENVEKRLSQSGLWDEILQEVRIALDIGMESIQKAYVIYWLKLDEDYTENDIQNARLIAEIDERLVKRENGVPYANTSIIWYYNKPATIKKMYFQKYSNDGYLKVIKDAIEDKRELRLTGRTNYDVSFSYSPEQNKGWYSEEYKNCGNGHYYLALDATHALFYEDD